MICYDRQTKDNTNYYLMRHTLNRGENSLSVFCNELVKLHEISATILTLCMGIYIKYSVKFGPFFKQYYFPFLTSQGKFPKKSTEKIKEKAKFCKYCNIYNNNCFSQAQITGRKKQFHSGSPPLPQS